ncbi:MAG: calcium/sodium antiporter [Clostridia bacterium]|jgi:cation:H+ antiporter|nr:calcium/sodium antiporter [Spirochaetia bacterium]
MILFFVAIAAGLVLLVWSAGKFVDGAATAARYAGMSPLLIGMVIIGFGTSMPEMVVSALASAQGNPGVALGNAYGSNIVNIGLILGLTAVLSPISVASRVVIKELPILLGITLVSGLLLLDGLLGLKEAAVLLVLFIMMMVWTIRSAARGKGDILAEEFSREVDAKSMSLKLSLFWLVSGLVVLIASSRLLVWGAVGIAKGLGVSDLVIGLTIVAVGTSLPELASSLVAIRKNEHDLALGNVIGSNMFNLLVVVGIAGAVSPMQVGPEVLYRDWVVMAGLTVILLPMCLGYKKPGRINRLEGALLMVIYAVYTGYLVWSQLG